MRPIKMIMTAFGPYRNRQEIDFNQIKDYQLFVISGKTGAGKTTIFDAICFALYGEANGEDRSDTKMLRSDFADDNTYTSVELEFELRGRKYRVEREMPHIKHGKKSPSGGKVELYEITTDAPIPCLDKFHKAEVNKKLIDLIGLSKDQFSQIVMLPQGEFRKLLTSETDNKEQILRRIFKTDSFKVISDFLDQRRKIALNETQSKRTAVDTYIGSISTSIPLRADSALYEVFQQDFYSPKQVIDGLSVEVKHYVEKEIRMKDELEKAHLLYKQKESEYHLARAINDRFQALDALKLQVEELENKKDEYIQKELLLKQADKASFIEPYEEQLISARETLQEKWRMLERKSRILEQLNEQLQTAEETYTAEALKEAERTEVANQVQQYQGWIPTVTELDTQKKQIEDLYRTGVSSKQGLDSINKLLANWKNDYETARSELRQEEEEVQQLPNLQKRMLELTTQEKQMRQYLKLEQDLHLYTDKLNFEKKKCELLDSLYSEWEAKWFVGQASYLAQNLIVGQACPVCGSCEHPSPAHTESDVPSKELLDQKKRERDTQNQQFQKLKAAQDATSSSIEQIKEELSTWGLSLRDPNYTYQQLVTQLKDVQEKMVLLEQKNIKIIQLRETIIKLEQNIALKDKEKERQLSLHQEIKLEYTRQVTIMESATSSIPEEVRVLDQLQELLDQARKHKSEMDKNWKRAQEDAHRSRLAATKGESEKNSATSQHLEAQLSLDKAEQKYTDELYKAEFMNEEAYFAAKMNAKIRETLREELEQYKTSIHTFNKQLEDMDKELEGKVFKELDSFILEVQQLSEQYKNQLQESSTVLRYREDSSKLKEFISHAYLEYEQKERNLQLITNLHNMVKGDNELKLSFERYLQIEYLESIIKAANERLKKMTNGQFQLDRRRDREARGRQSGLGLDVLDAYTGQYRDVKSLSGGEKFKASLCLALGLSDVIQSHDGGISIETMFIDEGFGSLDEESLNEAIEILVELQKAGRMIGVISHVQELKNTIPAVLEVQKTREGFSQAQFIIRY